MNEYRKELFREIRKKDTKPIGNIILNLCGCEFCEAFDTENCGDKKTSCTDYIDNFIKDFYSK